MKSGYSLPKERRWALCTIQSSTAAIRQNHFYYNEQMFGYQVGGEIFMGQAVKTDKGMPSFTKKIGQTIFKVNVYFAENTTATFEDRLLHLMVNDIAKEAVRAPDTEPQA